MLLAEVIQQVHMGFRRCDTTATIDLAWPVGHLVRHITVYEVGFSRTPTPIGVCSPTAHDWMVISQKIVLAPGDRLLLTG